MPAGQNIIELGFNYEELSAEKKQVLDLLVDMFEQLKKYDGAKFNPLGAGGLADLKKSLQDGQAALNEFLGKATQYNQVITEQFQKDQQARKAKAELSAEEKIHAKTLSDTVGVKAKIKEADTNAANDLAIQKTKLAELNREVNANAKAYASQIGSVNEAKATIAQLTIERNKENATTVEGKARITELNAEIDKNNEFIRVNSALLEKQKINIGNYTGAAAILRETLDSIDAKLAAMAEQGDVTGDAFARLTLEQNLVKAALQKQEAGFVGVTSEIRATKVALDTLTVAGFEHTEAFARLNEVYTTSKQKLTELHQEQAILTSEEPGFTALAAAARGLGGAYALGAGASALFADGNEKVEKELNKLVAIMTVLQGLEETVKALKERGAIATGLQTFATKLLNTARQVEISLGLAQVETLQTENVARVENEAVTEAQTAAGLGAAESSVVQAGALESVIGATEGATLATVGFRTALISTGIGALIIGIIYLITKLVGLIGDWISADERLEASEKAVIEASKELVGLQKQLADVYEKGARDRLLQLEQLDAKQKAQNINQFSQLDNERNIESQRKQIARDELQRLGITQQKLDEYAVIRQNNTVTLIGLEEDLRAASEKSTNIEKDETVKNIKNEIDKNKQIVDLFEKRYGTALDLQKDYNDSAQKLDENASKQAVAAAELLAKISLDAAERRYASVKAANDRVLNVDTSTSGQRIGAIASNYAAEAALEHAHEADLRRQFNANIIVEKDFRDQVLTLRNDLEIKRKQQDADRLKEIIDARDREAAAKNSISKSGNESEIATEQTITADVKKELNERIDALKISVKDRTAIIVDDFAEQLRLAKEHGKTETEIDAIQAEEQKALVSLAAQTQKEIYDVYATWGERKLKLVEEQNKLNPESADVNGDFNRQTEALNTGLLTRTINYTQYVNAKRRLDRIYDVEKARAAVIDDEDSLKRIQQDEAEIKSKQLLADARLAAAKASGDSEAIKNAQAAVDALAEIQRKAHENEAAQVAKLEKDKQAFAAATVAQNIKAAEFLHAKEKELAEATVNLGQTLVDAGYEYRKNQIQKLIDKQQEQTQNEIDGVNRSTLNQQDKEAELIIIQAQAHQREIQLKREQKQEDIAKAKFDREVAAAKVAWHAAEAEIAAIAEYGGTPYGFAIGAVIAALAAVEIATIFATPIPTYADGTLDHPGGKALIGEAGMEVVKEPGKPAYLVDTATVTDLAQHTKVIPVDPSAMIWELGGISLQRSLDMINGRAQQTDPMDVARWQTSQFKKIMENSNKQLAVDINIKIDNDWNRYVETKILGKK